MLLQNVSYNSYYKKIHSNWVETRLGNLIELKSGVDLKLTQINSNGVGIPYLTGASCFDKDKIIVSRWTNCPTNISEKGDILVTVKGTIGLMSFNKIGQSHIARQFMSIRVSKFICSDFIFFLLQAKKNKLTKKSSGLIPGIARESILELPVLLPPYNEQLRIANLLKNIIKKIDDLNKKYSEIEHLVAIIKRKILDNIFGKNSSYKSYYPAFMLNKICKLTKRNESASRSLPYLEVKVIRGKKTAKFIDKGSLVYKSEKMILVDGENSGEVMTAPYDGYMGSTFKLLTINTKNINLEYLSYYFLYHRQEFKENKTGSAIPHLNKKIFNSLLITVPPLEQQFKVVTKLTNIFNLLNIIS